MPGTFWGAARIDGNRDAKQIVQWGDFAFTTQIATTLKRIEAEIRRTDGSLTARFLICT